MEGEFQQYRFARIEAQNITKAQLETQFKNTVTEIEALERTIQRLLTTEVSSTPWRNSEIENAGSRDGTRMAALEFYWTHRRRLPRASESQ
jgi:hypothetical protein